MATGGAEVSGGLRPTRGTRRAAGHRGGDGAVPRRGGAAGGAAAGVLSLPGKEGRVPSGIPNSVEGRKREDCFVHFFSLESL